MKKILLLLTWLFFLSSAASAMTKDEAFHLFVRADLVYKEAKYQEAAGLYEQILSGGWESGPVYYNLGNCYFRQGVLGKSILNYERARRLIPRDSDLRANLRYALSTQNWALVENRTFLEKVADQISNSLSVEDILWLLLFLAVLTAVLHLTSLYFPVVRAARTGVPVAGILAMILVALAVLIAGQQKDQAVVLSGTAAKFEPREGATTYFEVYEGQKVRMLKNDGSWKKIERRDGKIGWIEQNKVEKI